MLRFSEFVSLGHPDKIADYIAQYLLDRYIERDPATRYAVEVQIKDSIVTLGGEVSSHHRFTDDEIAAFVRAAVNDIGYTAEYQQRWGAENTICGDSLAVNIHISQQSGDIAQGLTGWGDQGIFFGFCEYRPDTCGMPLDHTIAKRLCKGLFESGIGGLDIKTQVIMRDGKVEKVIVAIPLLDDTSKKTVRHFVRSRVKGRYKLIINGTGRYVAHSSIADCGTTGRKLAVDFYGGNCKIGGGSPWTKDASKADLTLNLVARRLAVNFAKQHKVDVVVSLACCIGKQEVDFIAQDTAGNILAQGEMKIDPQAVRRYFKLDTPIYASMCRWGLFGEFQQDKNWE
ncbi:methionine adenosyltransferase domain-containing protein [Alistipes sp.]|uniref:methionine adenosyltransferase domain-containing protein n=1 Tax=Alistipes sp. TaxID=1872444 RepID=UPI003529BAD8